MSLKPKTIKIAPDVWASSETGVVYDFTDRQYSRTKPHKKRFGNIEIVSWGSDNLLPYYNRQLLAENDVKQKIINTDVDLILGKGLTPVQVVEDPKDGTKKIKFIYDPQLEDFIEDFMLNEFFRETLLDLKEMGNSWPEYLLNNGRSKCTSVMSMDAVDCRLSTLNKNSERPDSETLYVADWKYSQLKPTDIESVPLLHVRNPILGKFRKCAIHIKQQYSGQPYYTLVEWNGTKIWTRISGLVPEFHESALKNGANMRYHLKVPWSYLENRITQVKRNPDNELTEEQIFIKVKKEIAKELDDVLNGAKNAGKTLNTWINDNLPNGQAAEWKIETIQTDLKDDSYVELLKTADRKHMNGHGLHPVLAGLETTGTLSSGSEILNLVNYHVQFKTPTIRRTAMKAINPILKLNFPEKWENGIRLGIEDTTLTTQDQNKQGITVSIPQTSDQ